MSSGFLFLVFTSIVDTVPLRSWATKAVLPSGVTASPVGLSPTMMSVGFLVLVFTSIVDTVSLPLLATNAVARHRRRVASVDAPVGTPPTSAPANPNTTTPRTHRTRRITAPYSPFSPASIGPTRQRTRLGLRIGGTEHDTRGAESIARTAVHTSIRARWRRRPSSASPPATLSLR